MLYERDKDGGSECEALSVNPNERLAIQIADALIAGGLIKESHREQLLGKLKSGGTTQEDWNLWVDMATARPDVAPAEFTHE